MTHSIEVIQLNEEFSRQKIWPHPPPKVVINDLMVGTYMYMYMILTGEKSAIALHHLVSSRKAWHQYQAQSHPHRDCRYIWCSGRSSRNGSSSSVVVVVVVLLKIQRKSRYIRSDEGLYMSYTD